MHEVFVIYIKKGLRLMQTAYLHILLMCGVCAAALASLLGIAVDLTLVAGFGRQRVIIAFSFLTRTTRAATEAQTRDTVPVGPTQSC